MKQLENIRIARVSTIPFFVFTQLSDQIEAIIEAGAIVSVISSNKELSDHFELSKNYDFIPIFIPREINIREDLVALFKLWRLFRVFKFDIIHSTTPKAGLLCAVAAKMAFTPICIHTFTGQTWVTLKGIKRNLVKWCDKLIGWFNTRCYADSLSQKDYLIQHKIIDKNKLFVLGEGSLAGVNIQRFCSTRFSESEKVAIKATLNIANDPVIILFVGRITKDKGVFELIDAFEQIVQLHENVILLCVGPMGNDIGHPFQSEVRTKCANKVIFTGFSDKPEYYMAIADILCIPSYREGFGTVAIEAAAMGLPVVGTRIYGLTDAIIDGTTGLLVEPKNSLDLENALIKLIKNEKLRDTLGNNAKKRAHKCFDSKFCNDLLIQEYTKLLNTIKIEHSQ